MNMTTSHLVYWMCTAVVGIGALDKVVSVARLQHITAQSDLMLPMGKLSLSVVSTPGVAVNV